MVKKLSDRFGICQWIHYEDENTLENIIKEMGNLGLKHLRTGISWADFHRKDSEKWFDHMIKNLNRNNLELLICVWNTPPSISEGNCCSTPPRDLKDYADFIDLIIGRYGDCFETIELWNEPNGKLYWNFEEFDPRWEKFASMINMASYWAKHLDKKVVLGGIMPIDYFWIENFNDLGGLENIDIIGVHGFPGMWGNEHKDGWEFYSQWRGWDKMIDIIRPIISNREIWITESGYSPLNDTDKDLGEYNQINRIIDLIGSKANRIYLYSLFDLSKDKKSIKQELTGEYDYFEHSLGIIDEFGRRKKAYYFIKDVVKSNSFNRYILEKYSSDIKTSEISSQL